MNIHPRHLAKAVRNYVVFDTFTLGSYVRFPGIGDLYVNPQDNRGRAILDNSGVTHPEVTLLWRLLVKHFLPTIVLDIGANYGEVALSASYDPQTSVTLFEPNPALRELLEMSVAAHRNRAQIALRSELVSDTNGEQEFFVDHKWSGTSSAIGPILDESNAFKGNGAEKFEKIVVRSARIDDIFSGQSLSKQRLLFKIDVEGFESRVCGGMLKTLQNVEAFTGIVEFDRHYLLRAGTDPQAFFLSLRKLGAVMMLENGALKETGLFSEVPDHTDLVVTSGGDMLANLILPKMARLLFRV